MNNIYVDSSIILTCDNEVPMTSLFLLSAVAVCYESSFVYHLFVRDRYQNYIILFTDLLFFNS